MLYAQPKASQRQKYNTEYDLEELMGLTDSGELASSISEDDSWLKHPYPIKLNYPIALRGRRSPLTSDLDSITKQLRRTRQELLAARTRLGGVPSCPSSRLTNYSEPPNIAELIKPFIEEIVSKNSKPNSPSPMTFGVSSMCVSPKTERETEERIEPLFEKPGYSQAARKQQPLSASISAIPFDPNSLANSLKDKLERIQAPFKPYSTNLGVGAASSLSVICKAEKKPKLIRLTCSCMLKLAVKRHDSDCRSVACYQVTRAPRRKPSVVAGVLLIQKTFRIYLAKKKSYSITRTSQSHLIEDSNPATAVRLCRLDGLDVNRGLDYTAGPGYFSLGRQSPANSDLDDQFVRTPVRIKSTASLAKTSNKRRN
jgi:hypothetical protein